MRREYLIRGIMEVENEEQAEKARIGMAEDLLNMGWTITGVEIVGEGGEK